MPEPYVRPPLVANRLSSAADAVPIRLTDDPNAETIYLSTSPFLTVENAKVRISNRLDINEYRLVGRPIDALGEPLVYPRATGLPLPVLPATDASGPPALRGSTTTNGATGAHTTCSGTLPTGHVGGDLLIAGVGMLDTQHNSNDILAEAGWTELIAQSTDTDPRAVQRIFYKTDNGSETNPVFDLSENNNASTMVWMAAFTGDTVNAIVASAQRSDGNPTALPALTVAAQDMYELGSFHFKRGSTYVTSQPAGWDVLQAFDDGDYWVGLWGRSIATANPAQGDFSMNNGGGCTCFSLAVGWV